MDEQSIANSDGSYKDAHSLISQTDNSNIAYSAQSLPILSSGPAHGGVQADEEIFWYRMRIESLK
jgi:hypothetical protein